MSQPDGFKYFSDPPALYGYDHPVVTVGKGLPSGARAGQPGTVPEAKRNAGAKVKAASA